MDAYVPPGTFGDCPSRNGGYFCTRSKGHPLAHVAHGKRDCMLAFWLAEDGQTYEVDVPAPEESQ